MYIDALAFHTPMIAVYEKYYDILLGSPLLFVRHNGMSIRSPLPFVCGATCVKRIRDRMGHRSGAPCFLYAELCV
jgi:hypothetical protein